MASYFDLAPRIATLKAQGLTVEGDYKSKPPNWLVTALKNRDVMVVNAKGVKPADTIAMIRLSWLENLLHEIDELKGQLDEIRAYAAEVYAQSGDSGGK